MTEDKGCQQHALLTKIPESSASDSEHGSDSDDQISMSGEGESDQEEETPEAVMAAMQVVKQAEKDGYDVFAMYKTAKMQQRGKTKARGFFKKGSGKHPQGQSFEERSRELKRAKATSTCRACGEVGHYWAKDPVCLKFGSRDGKDSKKKDILVMNVTEENTVQLPLVEAFAANSTLECHCPAALGILDSGCQKTVMGLFVFQAWERKLLEMRILQNPVARHESTEVFQFGNNGLFFESCCLFQFLVQFGSLRFV